VVAHKAHTRAEKRNYIFYRFSDQVHFNTPMIPTYYGAGQASVTRIDGAPRWNRESNKILVGGVADDGSRQLFIIRIQPENE